MNYLILKEIMVEFELNKYIIHFEPMDVEAESVEDIEEWWSDLVKSSKICSHGDDFPTILKVILAKYSFDSDDLKGKEPPPTKSMDTS